MKLSILFHLPQPLNPEAQSASGIRPIQVLAAFRQLGYEVDVIAGYARERLHLLKSVQHNVERGKRYAFCYSESSTMPSQLTEPHHFPVYPSVETQLFRWCKKQGIAIGVYYRDIHWRFPGIAQGNNWLKRLLAWPFYLQDLKRYQRYADIVYVPHVDMAAKLPKQLQHPNTQVLMPGAPTVKVRQPEHAEPLTLLYVGGIQGIYDISLLYDAVADLEQVRLLICCRENEWGEHRLSKQALPKNIEVFHYGPDRLAELYNQAHVCCLLLRPQPYLKLAMPLKVFEYLAYQKPILSFADLGASAWIQAHHAGWVLPYDTQALRKQLQTLRSQPKLLQEKIKQIQTMLPQHTWLARARQVEETLNATRTAL